MSVSLYLEIINAVLLLSGSALLFIWKKDSDKKGDVLIMRIGFSTFFFGIYKLLSITFQATSFNGWIPAISSIPALIGLAVLMFSLFNYLEARK